MATRSAAPAARVDGGERLHVDWTACDGRGLCTELLPELLGRDDWGYPVPRGGDRDPVVPPALSEHARRATALCPRLALRLLPR
jgi:ferredoxin